VTSAYGPEGHHPIVSPNAGYRQEHFWTSADAQLFGERLRAEFPQVLFYVVVGSKRDPAKEPQIDFLERLGTVPTRDSITAFFPYPGWQPELVWVEKPQSGSPPYWTWRNYLSPILSIEVGPDSSGNAVPWSRVSGQSRHLDWPADSVSTSYRRSFPDEARIARRVIALVRSMCVRTVPVFWKSESDYRAGTGIVSRAGMMLGHGRATPSVVEWYRAEPDRSIGFHRIGGGGAFGCLPVDEVPDSWWDGIRRPKWAQLPR